ncbi:MAG: hypothetical protein JXQ27_16215 [Acidobacteria bacterium]|nr:hypothetical protein [Acidobacteriota bacterium]
MFSGFVLFLVFVGNITSTLFGSDEVDEPLFYPALPVEPRIQFLATISDTGFVLPEKSGFFRFVFGDEKEKEKILPIVKPYGVAIHDGRLYVCDLRSGLLVLNLENDSFSFLGTAEPGRLKKAVNLDIARNGDVFVADIGREQILSFDKKGNFQRAYGKTGDFRPSDVKIWRSRLYVADMEHNEIVILNVRDGKEIARLGGKGKEEGKLLHPSNIALDSLGNLYVSETTNFRISVFGQDGSFVRTFGQIGRRPGDFARNKGIALDRGGNFWVVDSAFENVQIFNPQGELLLFFLGSGQGRGNINLPADIWIDYENIDYFRKYADPRFDIKCLVFVTSQFGPNKINVYAHGSYAR